MFGLVLSVLTALYLFYHNKSEYTSTFFSLDTIVSISSDKNIVSQIKSKIEQFDNMLDVYSEKSEIYLLNAKKELTCSTELTELINNTILLSKNYGTRLDISLGNITKLWSSSLDDNILPDNSLINKYLSESGYENIISENNYIKLKNNISLDTGSVSKGYVLDCLMENIQKYDTEHTIISLGSSTLLYSNDKDYIFNVGIKSGSTTIAGTVSIGPCFVSTSGDYERYALINGIRYHHIIDNTTGYPSDSDLSSVTVFCQSGIESDFLSTLIFIEGKENLKKHLNANNYSIVAIDTQGNIYKSENLKFSS